MSQDDGGFKPSEMVGDLVRKALTVGVGAVFLTEESIKALVKQYKIPTELVGGLIESASRTKDEFLKDLSNKLVSQIMDKVDLKALLNEALEHYEADINVKFKARARKAKHD
ncbi:MAG TPA: hypothetical protein VL588_00675 [Bdellovibrionota bacterium]|nr:hypothetical protein [Bdellovibrionota bacterium]